MTDAWHDLRRFTAARIALGRAGGSLLTEALLDFRLAHARARDAVGSPFDAIGFTEELRALGVEVLCVESKAATQPEFLRRPDLGRRLAAASRAPLKTHARAKSGVPFDLALIVSNGLSSLATTRQAPSLLAALIPLIRQSGWSLAPLIVAANGRVALQDEIGALLGARLSLMLLGERPGLGASDSLGAYFTYGPRPGRTDAERNCVSNIRPEGLPPAEAAHKLFHLIGESFRRRLSGVDLKDETQEPRRVTDDPKGSTVYLDAASKE
jgi:ethanolamine ammonia-lyase small subunit